MVVQVRIPAGSLCLHFLPGYACLHACFVSPLPCGGLGMPFHVLAMSQGLHLGLGTHVHPYTCLNCPRPTMWLSMNIPAHVLAMSRFWHMVALVFLFTGLACHSTTTWQPAYVCLHTRSVPGLLIGCVGTPVYMPDCPRTLNFRHGIVPEPRV